MSLFTRIRLYTFLATIPFDVLIFCIFFFLASHFPPWTMLLGLLPAAGAGYFVSRYSRRFISPKLLRRATESCVQAFESGDIPKGRRAGEEIVAVFRRFRRQPALAIIAEADFLGFEERFDDALAELDRIDSEQIDPRLKPYILNSQAWYQAQLGKVDEAIKLAKAALDLVESSGSRILPSCRGTLGTALFLAHQPNEALPLLLEAFEGHSGHPRLRAINAYYLGAAYSATNRLPQARSWFECAAREAPNSRFAAMAVAALREFP